MPLKSLAALTAAVVAIIAPTAKIAAADADVYAAAAMPQSWANDSHFDPKLPSEDAWWLKFDDQILDSLIADGVNSNYDIASAIKRCQIARNSFRSAKGGYYPSLSADAGWTKARTSGLLYGDKGSAETASHFSLGASMSWEIDLFGRIGANVGQKKAGWMASQAEQAGVMVSVCAEIATYYFQLRTLQAEIGVAKQHITTQAKIVKLTEARKEAGLASALDVSQALVVYNSTVATLPQLENSVRTTINAIAVLLGRYPQEIYDRLAATEPQPAYVQVVATDVPLSLLRRRPDVVQAEMEISGYAAAVGVAKKDFLPTLSLNGTIGTSAHKAGDLFERQSVTYSISPTLSWTMFDGLQRKYNLASAREQLQLGIDNYNSTLITAVSEVDNAISTYLSALSNISSIENVVAESQRSLDLSVDLYKRGLSPFSNVATAQISLLQYQDQEVVAKGDALAALVSLYKALGGGWDASEIQSDDKQSK